MASGPDEFRTAFELAWNGSSVESRGDSDNSLGDLPAVAADDEKGFDAYVDGVRSEFKVVRTNKPGTIKRVIDNAGKQHADRIYIRVEGVDANKFNGDEGGLALYHQHQKRSTRLTQIAVFGTDSDGDRWNAPVQNIGTELKCDGFFGC